MSELATVPVLVGQRVRELREETGRSQDELAAAARRAGLAWTRGSVASLETGRRGLSAEELLLLPLALTILDERDHTLSELLTGESKVAGPTGPPILTSFLRHLVADGSALGWGAWERQRAGGMAGEKADQRTVAYMAAREAERYAATALDISAEEVARTSYRQWRRGLTEERERRVRERAAEDASPRSLQAIRGHVTRELLDELWQTLEEGSNG